MRCTRRIVLSLTVAAILAACGGGNSSLAGRWTCRSPSNATGDSVVLNADGTVNLTTPGGQSASGTWTVNGSTLTVHGLGPGGTEDFTITGDQITGQGGQVCTRAG